MMRLILLSIASTALFSSAVAQLPDPMSMMRDMRTSPSTMLANPEFKKDLKLAGDQSKKIDLIVKENQKRNQELSKKMGSNRNDFAAMKAVSSQIQANQKEADTKIFAELNAEQTQRLTQLRWQILGPKALYETDLQKALELSAEQVAKIDAYKEGDSARMMEAMRGGGRDMMKKMKEVTKKDREELLSYLSPEQQSKYKLILGPENKAATKQAELPF